MSNARRFLENIVSAEEAGRQVPEMTPQCEQRQLCVGMATFDDFDGVAYDRILADIPAPGKEFDQWLSERLASDQYLGRCIRDGIFRAVITSPRVASQPPLLAYGDADRELAERYII